MNRIRVIFLKEVIDNLRDGRSLASALAYPLLGPVLVGVLIGLMTSILIIDREALIHIAVGGAENAPALASYLGQHGVVIEPAPDDPVEAVRRGRTDTVLMISDGFARAFDERRPATVKVVVNTARLASLITVGRLLDRLRGYGREVTSVRLAAEGIDPSLVEPIRIENINVTRGTSLIDFFLSMLPPFIIFNAFIGGVYLALDTTSGERERRSLEPLLINPVARWEVLLGKVFAGVLFTLAAVVVQLLAFKLMFEAVGTEPLNFEDKLDPASFLATLVLTAPLVLFAVAVQTIIATMTRSFKEAQTYLGLLPLVPGLPGLALVFVPVEAEGWMMTVPTFGQTLLLGQLIRGEPVLLAHAAITMVATLVVSAILLLIAARLYEREELIFGS